MRSSRRAKLIHALSQPMTVGQLARASHIDPDTCSRLLAELAAKDLVFCLNRTTGRHRLYWFTGLGLECRGLIDDSKPIAMLRQLFPTVDWHLYGAICFRHRAAVIKALRAPMKPAEIKRRLRLQQPDLRISANNIRDVIGYLKKQGVVRQVRLRRRGHPSCALTGVGEDLRRLLETADMGLPAAKLS